MTLFLWFLALGVLFIGLAHLLRVLPPQTGLVVFLVALGGVGVYGLFYPYQSLSTFVALKLVSVCIGLIFMQWMKFTNPKWYPLAQKLGYAILFINILEATFFDFLDTDYFNTLLGVALLISLKGPSALTINQDSKYRDCEYDISFVWMLAYCFWNTSFVYNFEGGVALTFAFLHLGLPLIMSFFTPQLFFQNRVYYLTFTVVLITMVPPEPLYFESSIYIPWIAHALTVLGFACIGMDILARRRQLQIEGFGKK